MSLDFSRKADSHEPAPVFQTRGLCGSAGPGSREPWQWAEPGGAHLGCRRGGKNQNASVAADSPVTAGAYVASQTVKKKVIEINQYMLGTRAGGPDSAVTTL